MSAEKTDHLPVSLVETRQFSADAAKLLSEEEISALKLELALYPTNGVLIPGTSGLRKLRVGAGSRGKRGGARVIYYYHSEDMPILLVAIYAKSERADLTSIEKKRAQLLIKEFVEFWHIRRG